MGSMSEGHGSPLANALSAIMIQHHYRDTALEPCVALLGDDQRDQLVQLLQRARKTLRYHWHGDFLKYIAAHCDYCQLFASLCGYPDEATTQMIKDGASIIDLAHRYGWRLGQYKTLLAGELDAHLR